MSQKPKSGAVLAASCILLFTSVRVLADDELVGRDVIAIRPDVILRQAPEENAPPVDYSFAAPVWKVREAKGDWFRVGGGWLRSTEFMLTEQAADYFTAQIEMSPTAYAYAARSRVRLLAKGDVDGAASDVEVAMRIDPHSCHSLRAKASLLSNAGRSSEAVKCYSRLIELDPSCKEVYGKYAIELVKQNNIPGAIDVLSMSLKRWPRDSALTMARAIWYGLRGALFAKDGNHVAAEETYSCSLRDWTEALSRSPSKKWEKECAKTYTARAESRIALDHLDEAISDLSQSLALVPDDPLVQYERGRAYALNNQHRLACEDCRAAIKLGLKDARVHMVYGRSLLMLGQNDDAIANLNESIRLDDQNSIAFELRGRAWFKKASYRRAIADFDKAIALAPSSGANYESRAAAWQMLKEYDKSIEDFNSAIKLNPNSSHALAGRAVSFANQGEFKKAIEDCDAALRMDRTISLAYQTRGSLMIFMGDYKQAASDLSKAISLNPMDEISLRNRTTTWLSLGEYGKALSDFDAYLRLYPQSSEGYRARAKLLALLGKSREAADDVRTAEHIDAQRSRK